MDSKEVALKSLIQASMHALVGLFVLLLLNAASVFLVVFAGILRALLFRGLTDWFTRKTKMPEMLSLALAIVVPLALFGVGAWLIAPDVAEQDGELAEKNINPNSIAPGLVLTPMNQAAIDDPEVRKKQV